MDRNRDIIADHLPLEEIMIDEIDGIQAPDNWVGSNGVTSPEIPPVVIEEARGYSLVGNHRTVWHLRNAGKLMVKCLVVRSIVHVKPAHQLIGNCTEEAMLFDGILRRSIVPNRSRLADILGYSRARITQLLNQLKLPLNIRQQVLLSDDVSEFKLRPLLKFLEDEEKLQAGFKKLMDGKLSGRQIADFTNSDNFQNTAKDTGGGENLDIKTDDSGTSVAELEEVFATEGMEETETDDKKTSIPESQTLDMTAVLRQLGNVRETGWKARVAEYSLPPVEMEFLEGILKIRSGLYTDAMNLFEEVVSENSNHHLAWFYLGRCCNLTGALQQAEEYIRNAISRYPENADYLVELAVVLEKLKRHSEAEAFYRKSALIRKALATGK
jgi:tetratricopeptide (TPR) repeat protein